MFTKLIVTILFIVGCSGLNRDEIISEYEPILTEHGANLTAEYQRCLVEANLVVGSLVNDTQNIVSLLDGQITSLQTTIINAENISESKPNTLACLQTQEAAAEKLSSDAINVTCWNDEAFAPLTTAEEYYVQLSKVPDATIAACGILDPIPNQDELFLECITEKIVDLNGQLAYLRSTFDSAKSVIMESFLQCLGDQSAVVAQKINEINVQVTLCLTLP